MTSCSSAALVQMPLIEFVDEDDKILLESSDSDWYKILYYFPFEDYCDVAAKYYDALYHYNLLQKQKRKEKALLELVVNNESKEEAEQRLLFDRATMNDTIPIIYEEDHAISPMRTVSPLSLAPGIVPFRIGGKKPKCFFALFKSFIGATIMGFQAEPKNIHLLLTTNLPFARVCGFVPKGNNDQYWAKHVPSLRKIEQFDMIMADYGIWSKLKWDEVHANIKNGVIRKENELVGDTTHYHAYSSFETSKYIDEKGKEQTKSQSKVTKKCHCEDRENCAHPWELADDGAGTIVKAHNKYIWGHKASVLGLPRQGIPLDVVAMSDAATFDGITFFPHVERLFKNLPETRSWFTRVLYDSACNDRALKDKFWDKFKLKLKASLNPRRKKTVTENLLKGMKKITPYGNVICNGDFEMDYKGIRYSSEKFIYQTPLNEKDIPVCLTCEHKQECCPCSSTGRTINVSFDLLSHIDRNDPPMAKRFKAIMQRRPSVERMIKRLKCDLGDDRLKKRSNSSFQAYLDKTMIAFHILLRN